MKKKILLSVVPFITAMMMTMPTQAAEVKQVKEVAQQDAATEETEEMICGGFYQETVVQTYSQEDLDILAHVICGEAQGYPDEEQWYVGAVVLNRVNCSRYPNSIKEVVFQKGQYACTRDGNYYRQPTEANYRNAKWLLENGSLLPGNIIYQSKGTQGRASSILSLAST